MQAKNIILNQLKLISQLKIYLTNMIYNSHIEAILNRQFSQFLQNIDPKIYGKQQLTDNSLLPTLSSNDQIVKGKNNENAGTNEISIPNIFANIWKEEVKIVNIPKWKTKEKKDEFIVAKTRNIVSVMALSKSDYETLLQIENLINHMKIYPEAKHWAVKEGAIRLLLRIKNKYKTYDEIQFALNEAFALIGYAHPVKANGIRILSIDGGGTRGVLVIEMLRKLEELSGKPIYEMFDLICGVSTGAIIAALIGLKQYTLDEASECYKTISTQVFRQSTLKGTSSLVWCHSYYDTELWEKLLQEQMEKTLIDTNRNLKCPKYCAISAVVNQFRLSAYVFRNYSLPCKVQSQYLGGYDHKVWESVRASAAAPTYFEEFKIGNMIHQDGGILVNNPTAVAIHEAKLLWPTTPIQCIVSFGTGRTIPNPGENTKITNASNNTSWKHKFFAILDSATDTEGVHTMLSDLLPDRIYYRFNPYLTEMIPMSEIDSGKMEQLKRDAIMYLRRNEDKFHYAVERLSLRKNYLQSSIDWLNEQKKIYF